MSKYPKRYIVEILWGRSLMRAALDVACLPHGRWMEAEEVIKEIDKRDALIKQMKELVEELPGICGPNIHVDVALYAYDALYRKED